MFPGTRPVGLWPLSESNRHTHRVQNFEFCAYAYFAKGPLLRHHDSNVEYKCQKLGCYHYTMAQFYVNF